MIVVNWEPLDHWYVPWRLPYREDVVELLVDLFSRGAVSLTRCVAHLVGPSGVGKTAVARTVARRLPELAGRMGFRVKAAYVNLSWLSGPIRVCYAIAEEAGVKVKPGLDPVEVLVQVYERLREEDSWLLLILDDVDRFVAYHGPDLVYRLARWREGVDIGGPTRYGLLLAHRDPSWMEVDEALRQSLLGLTFKLEPYGVAEVRDILAQRVNEALAPGSFSVDLLDFTSRLAYSNGGPRYGLELIRGSAMLAERDGCDSVEADHVRFVHSSLRSVAVDQWELHEALLMHAIALAFESRKDRVYLTVREAEELYRVECELRGIEPKGFQEALDAVASKGPIMKADGWIALEAPPKAVKEWLERLLKELYREPA